MTFTSLMSFTSLIGLTCMAKCEFKVAGDGLTTIPIVERSCNWTTVIANYLVH